MPKKTKKQKILAEIRRKISQRDNYFHPHEANNQKFVKRVNNLYPLPHTVLPSYASPIPNKSIIKPKNPIEKADYTYIKHDLIKITIFSIFALFFQLMLYFVLRRG